MAAPRILSLDWNQDASCFACGMSQGFRIYSTHPLELRQKHDFDDGGVGQVEMLFRCNYVALVGGGQPPKYPTNKVLIWDDRKAKAVVELSFRSEVKAVRLRRDRIVVVLESRVNIFTFTQTPKRLHVFDTTPNPDGLCVLCPTRPILVFPGPERGQAQIVELGSPRKAPLIIAAHEAGLACLALSHDGRMLATASEKGTLIRIFDTATGRKISEVRRGSERAHVQSISFSHSGRMLCVSSNHGTVHVFRLASQPDNPQSRLGQSLIPKYFHSVWSFAKFSVHGDRSICAFSSADDAVVAATSSGLFYHVKFTEDGHVMVKKTGFLHLSPPALASRRIASRTTSASSDSDTGRESLRSARSGSQPESAASDVAPAPSSSQPASSAYEDDFEDVSDNERASDADDEGEEQSTEEAAAASQHALDNMEASHFDAGDEDDNNEVEANNESMAASFLNKFDLADLEESDGGWGNPPDLHAGQRTAQAGPVRNVMSEDSDEAQHHLGHTEAMERSTVREYIPNDD